MTAARDDLAARGVRVQVQRWFVETGWVDGNGIGLWDGTDESVEVANRAKAEALRDEWLASGKLVKNHWGNIQPPGSYRDFRIRNVWEDATPEALSEPPAVRAMVEAERERCARIVLKAGSKKSNRWINRADTLASIRKGETP